MKSRQGIMQERRIKITDQAMKMPQRESCLLSLANITNSLQAFSVLYKAECSPVIILFILIKIMIACGFLICRDLKLNRRLCFMFNMLI